MSLLDLCPINKPSAYARNTALVCAAMTVIAIAILIISTTGEGSLSLGMKIFVGVTVITSFTLGTATLVSAVAYCMLKKAETRAEEAVNSWVMQLIRSLFIPQSIAVS